MANIIQELRKLKSYWMNSEHNVKIITALNANVLTIYLIEVPVFSRRLGYGTEIMEELTCLADRYNLVLQCNPDESKGTPKLVLEKFYTAHGFRWANPNTMVREPLYPEVFDKS